MTGYGMPAPTALVSVRGQNEQVLAQAAAQQAAAASDDVTSTAITAGVAGGVIASS
jgi:hypothetical protein